MTVFLSKKVKIELQLLPKYIVAKLRLWILSVENEGIYAVRKTPGFHDEPLKGKRIGQRSIRLNQAYRAIYMIKENGTIEFIEILEVSKHDY